MGLERVAPIVNCVDVASFAPEPADPMLRTALAIDAGRRVVIHVSNLKPVKRPLDVVHCAATLRERCPDLLWLIVGEGACRAEMVDEITRLGLLDRFRFTRWTDHREVGRHLNIADVAVLPSETEGLPLFALEAMACGVPVVASNISATREVIADGQTGLLHRPADVDHMAEAVASLLEDEPARQRMGLSARHRAETSFDFTAFVNRWSKLLVDVSGSDPGVSADIGPNSVATDIDAAPT
jgi:glycosyltransferase involved in cell wall biosynthesis